MPRLGRQPTDDPDPVEAASRQSSLWRDKRHASNIHPPGYSNKYPSRPGSEEGDNISSSSFQTSNFSAPSRSPAALSAFCCRWLVPVSETADGRSGEVSSIPSGVPFLVLLATATRRHPNSCSLTRTVSPVPPYFWTMDPLQLTHSAWTLLRSAAGAMNIYRQDDRVKYNICETLGC